MGTDYFNVGWKLKALALTLILLLVLEGAFVVIVFWPGASDDTRVICIMATPLCFLIVMTLSSRLAFEFGWTESGTTDLDQLVERKRGGALKTSPESFRIALKPLVNLEPAPAKVPVPPELTQHVRVATMPLPTPKQTPKPITPVNDVLDRLVNWKRQHIGPTPNEL